MKVWNRLAGSFLTAFFLYSLNISQGYAAGAQILRGNIPPAVTTLQPAGRLSATNFLNLAIGLPLRNQAALSNLLQQIYDPASPNYRHYLTPEQFAERFGPTERDYQTVIAFANANGLRVTGTHPNRMLLDVRGSVTDVERALHVTMRTYRHPTENRIFFCAGHRTFVGFDRSSFAYKRTGQLFTAAPAFCGQAAAQWTKRFPECVAGRF